ncbi:MAG: hypothetical protein QOE23_2246 [Pseudonocardiales bacterium]|nr:hypothetical protein [Pseudonocardiales bacterium]
MHVAFFCRVFDSILLLEGGCSGDIRELLFYELFDDDQLIADLMTGRGPNEPLHQILGRGLARGRKVPPVISGMDVRLASAGVEVHPDTETCQRCPNGSWMGQGTGWGDGDPGSCDIRWD